MTMRAFDVKRIKRRPKALPKVSWRKMKKIYEILSKSCDDPKSTGNLAERHNEHQP